MLVDHPHPGVDRGARRAELDWTPVDHDLALVGVVEPVQDVHQRRLAGAVLPEERVDLARAEIEADVVVCDDAGEALRDPAHLEDNPLRLGHRPAILRSGTPMSSGEREKCDGRARGPPVGYSTMHCVT